MFLFEPIPWYSAVAWFVVLGTLILLNEISRRSVWAAVFFFIVLPIVLPFTLWQHDGAAGESVGTWFHWVKVYSAIAGCVGFMLIRYTDWAKKYKALLFFPAFILGLNILEAVIRELQVSTFATSLHDGMVITGGKWNIVNGIAGILNIVTICGWAGIVISQRKSKDMLWPDMLWFWIIAYDLWNFAYVYNCVPDHSFYAGAALLLACTIPSFTMAKGAWLQHRAHTLAFWMMFVMAFPTFVDSSMFAVKASQSTDAMWFVSLLSIVANVGVFGYQIRRIFVRKLNPLKDELYTDLNAYKSVKETAELVDNQAMQGQHQPA